MSTVEKDGFLYLFDDINLGTADGGSKLNGRHQKTCKNHKCRIGLMCHHFFILYIVNDSTASAVFTPLINSTSVSRVQACSFKDEFPDPTDVIFGRIEQTELWDTEEIASMGFNNKEWLLIFEF